VIAFNRAAIGNMNHDPKFAEANLKKFDAGHRLLDEQITQIRPMLDGSGVAARIEGHRAEGGRLG
jgi:hypothetical protein